MISRLVLIVVLLSSLALAQGGTTFDRLVASPFDQWRAILDASQLSSAEVADQLPILQQMVRDKKYDQAVLLARAVDVALATLAEVAPTENPTQVGLALALERRGQRKAAQEVSKNLKALAPGSATSLFVQGVLMRELNPVASLNLLTQARSASLPPQYLEECLQNMALCYAAQSKTRELGKTCEEILALNPNNAFAKDALRTVTAPESVETIQTGNAGAVESFNKAEAAFSKGDFASAIKFYDQAIAADPKFAKAYIYKGDAVLQQGNIDQAIVCYRKAIAIDPRDKQGHRFLGDTLHRKFQQNGDRKLLTEAISHFETALKIDPNYAMAQDSLSAAKAELSGR